jgi:hypothetical protein
LVDDSITAFSGAPFTGITDYTELDAGSYNFKVVPAGDTEPVVIEADLDLAAGTDYTVVAIEKLENIRPIVLVDDNSAPAPGMAHVRFVHASPDAPNVDIFVADGGPLLFENVPFAQASSYLPVDAGTYDLEVRVHDTGDVVLTVPGVNLAERTVYTVFAMGLAGGDPALQAVLSVDASHGAVVLPEAGGQVRGALRSGLLFLGVGLALVVGGLALQRRLKKVDVVQ